MRMKEFVTWIKEDELSSLSIEVLDYSDRISEIFDKIDNTISKLPTYYQDSACTKLMSYYHELAENYSVIKQNIVSYSDDLTTLIKKMRENDKYMASLFQNATENTKNKIRSVKEIGGR